MSSTVFISKLKRSTAVIFLAALLPVNSLHAQSAATNSDVQTLQREITQMKQDYEQRIEVLEQQVHQLEAAQSNKPAPATPVAVAPTNPPPPLDERYDAFAKQQFQDYTGTRAWAIQHEGNSPLDERIQEIVNNYVDITGYFRAGYGRDDKGGPQPAFQAPGAFAKYRLGNEAENYGELAFGKNWYVPGLFSPDNPVRPDGTPSGPIARTQVRIAFYNPYGTSTFNVTLPEAWAEIGNVSAAQPSLKFWAGNRFYRRQDINIDDFYFYNMSGAGGGFEDLELPFGKVALAWIGYGAQSGVYSSDIAALPDPNNLAGFSKENFVLSLYDVPVPLGKVELGLAGVIGGSGKDEQGQEAPNSSGVAVTLIHRHDHFLSDDGFNRVALQFGTGAAKTFTSGYETTTFTNGTFIVPDAPDSWRFRFTEDFTTQPWAHLAISPALVYQYTDYHSPEGRVQWLSAGIRPVYFFNKFFSLAAEGGVDYVDDNGNGPSGTLGKITLAPQISLGDRYFSRPVIRTFVTYALWSNGFKGQVGGNDYATDIRGLTWGVQMETWW
jgi:maltoporin